MLKTTPRSGYRQALVGRRDAATLHSWDQVLGLIVDVEVHLLSDRRRHLRRGEAGAAPSGPAPVATGASVTARSDVQRLVEVVEERADDVDRRRAGVDPAAEVGEPRLPVSGETADADDVGKGGREVRPAGALIAGGGDTEGVAEQLGSAPQPNSPGLSFRPGSCRSSSPRCRLSPISASTRSMARITP